jgi:hypothetical protein
MIVESVESIIRREYVDNQKSIAEIAKQLRTGTQYVKGYLTRMNINIRQYGTIKNTEYFINKSISIHGHRYDYSLSNYVNDKTFIDIICKKHGQFSQRPNNHYKKQGCPKCKMSHGETDIENYLLGRNIEYQNQYRFEDCRNKNPLPFDFAVWINGKLGLIEYNGPQHYKQSKIWNSKYNKLERTQLHDKIKQNYCAENNIPFLVISFKDIKYAELIVEYFISSL